MRILIFGGDERQIAAALCFLKSGHKVSIFAIEKNVLAASGADGLFTDSYTGHEAVVFPLPFSTDGKYINTPFSVTKYEALPILRSLEKGSLIFTGMASSFIKNAASEFGLDLMDYYESEDLQIKNAVPTAEGAVWTYMNNSKKTVCGSTFIGAGCGKIGRCLADRLHKLGGIVTVAARSSKDLSYAESTGVKVCNIEQIECGCISCDCIFNTVPCNIFDENFALTLSDGAIYIELASKPYGMDEKGITVLGKRHIFAPSLPGKTAPVTAGKIIADTIGKYI